jgi:hypothetical protein
MREIMLHSNQVKDQFLCPRSRYYGSYTPGDLVFNANLQEIAQKISLLSALHTGGNLSSAQALEQIEPLWQQLEQSHRAH